MSAPQSIFTADEIALSWANEKFPAHSQQLVSDHPWSKVFRLQGQNEAAYLKLVPSHEQTVLDKNALINKHFGNVTPKIKATDKKLGVMVIEEQISIPLGNSTSEEQIWRLLQAYAAIQGKAKDIEELTSALPRIDVKKLMDDFLQYLNPDNPHKNGVGAHFFMDDPAEAKAYFTALTDRKDLLNGFMEAINALPPTLNHCDLHTDNVSEREDGSIIIYDWDDAVIGPAGMSLYRLLEGCSHTADLLDDNKDVDESQLPYRRMIKTYENALMESGYADKETLRRALPAAVLAGSIQSLLSYQKFPQDDYFYKKDISEIIRTRVEDIVHLCDLLALRNRKDTLFYAENYHRNNVPWRSIYLLDQYSQKHPNDAGIVRLLATTEMEIGRWACAINSLNRLLAIYPHDAIARQDLGIAYVKNGQSELAIRELEAALEIDSKAPLAREYIQKASEIIHWRDRARVPHLAPALALTDSERNENSISYEKMDLAINMFREYGVVVVENAFPRALMEQVSKIVFEKYDNYFEDRAYEDNLVLGDKRRMVTLEIEGALNTPRIYGSRILTGMMTNLLGDDYVMGGLNAVVSLPGSRDQGLHKDYSPIFRSETDHNTHVTPSFAIAMLTPLIDMRREHGTTAFRKGSHLVPEQMPFDMPVQEPLLKMGDCVIFDYRTAHEGLANYSDEVRPLLCVVHHRIWFRDALNYNQQKDVAITADEYRKVPDEFRHLFKWSML